MEKTTLSDLELDLKKQILVLESMVEQYRDEMMKNWTMLNDIKTHIIRTNHLLINIRKIYEK